jgi:hypothetical protein
MSHLRTESTRQSLVGLSGEASRRVGGSLRCGRRSYGVSLHEPAIRRQTPARYVAIISAMTEFWGPAALQLIVFAGPGALLGLGASWMSYASVPNSWTWRTARNGALAGALLLPPILAFLVALDGNARPHRLLVGFIRAAWLALALGAAVAAARGLRDASEQRRQKVRARLHHALPPRSPEEVDERHLSGVQQIGFEHRVHLGRKRRVVNHERGFIVEGQ